MINKGQYIVSREIAIRSGLFEHRYRTADGRYILGESDLKRIGEVNPQDVERISNSEAQTLIARGGFVTGDQEKKKSRKKKS